MQKSTIVSAVLAISVLISGFTACKKYPDGGRIKKAEKTFHGGLNDGYTKRWKVTKYEVDGVDSTKTWKPKHSTDRFSYYDLEVSPSGKGLQLETEVYTLSGVFTEKKDVLEVFPLDNDNREGFQCYRTNICERNILLPAYNSTFTAHWTVQKLEKNELRFTMQNTHSYLLEMEYADQE